MANLNIISPKKIKAEVKEDKAEYKQFALGIKEAVVRQGLECELSEKNFANWPSTYNVISEDNKFAKPYVTISYNSEGKLLDTTRNISVWVGLESLFESVYIVCSGYKNKFKRVSSIDIIENY